MAKRNISYQVQSQADGTEPCVVIDKDTGNILAQASSADDLERFETDLVRANFTLDMIAVYVGFIRNHFRQKPGGASVS
jgi:hypothetical protein